MKSLLVTPSDKNELKFLKELFDRLAVHCSVISTEEIEDYRLGKIMIGVDRKKKTPKVSILKKLRKRN